MKNLIDVGMGGFVYWSFGFGLVYGDHPYSTPYYGVGHFFFRPDPKVQGSGELYLRYFSSAAMSAFSTSVISGAMAERLVYTKN